MKQLLDLLTLAKDVSGAQEVSFSVTDFDKGKLIVEMIWDDGEDLHTVQMRMSAGEIGFCAEDWDMESISLRMRRKHEIDMANKAKK